MVELKGTYQILGLKVRVLPHVKGFLWRPVECLEITRRVEPEGEVEDILEDTQDCEQPFNSGRAVDSSPHAILYPHH